MHTQSDVAVWLRCKDEEPDPRQIAIWQRMTADQKLALAFGMYDFMKEMIRCHLRREHPEFSPEQIESLVRERFTRHE